MTEERRKRQYEEILDAYERDDRDRARALAYEHVIEYPDEDDIWAILDRLSSLRRYR